MISGVARSTVAQRSPTALGKARTENLATEQVQMWMANSLPRGLAVVPHKPVPRLHEPTSSGEAAGRLGSDSRKPWSRVEHLRQRLEVPDRYNEQVHRRLRP